MGIECIDGMEDPFATFVVLAHDAPPKKTDQTLLVAATLVHLRSALTAAISIDDAPKPLRIAPSDRFHFGHFWKEIRGWAELGLLNRLIHERRQEIKKLKEEWRPLIQVWRDMENREAYLFLDRLILEGELKPIEEGMGSSYCLFDADHVPRVIVKPADEDILCLHNRKHYGGPFPKKNSYRVRQEIPLYRSAQTDALCYEVGCMLGVPFVSPKTMLAILTSNAFFDIADNLESVAKGKADKEKLCSVQEYVPDSENFMELIQKWIDQEASNEEIAERIDQTDFEDANFFIWVIYDTDAHAANFRAYVKRIDPLTGNKVYGLKKIDNALAFPAKNKEEFNYLAFLPNAERTLSQRTRDRIRAIPVAAIIEKMHLYRLASCVAAFKERIEVLQQLAAREDLTIVEIDLRMQILQIPMGRQWALSSLSREELEAKLEQHKPATNSPGQEFPRA